MAAVKKKAITIEDLPDEVIVNIFSFLTISELAQVSAVCRLWRELAADKQLWRGLFVQYWGEEAALLRDITLPWKRYFTVLACPKQVKESHVKLTAFLGPGPVKRAYTGTLQPEDKALSQQPVVILMFYQGGSHVDEELELMKRLHHPRICRLLGYIKSSQNQDLVSLYYHQPRHDQHRKEECHSALIVERCDVNLSFFLSSRYHLARLWSKNEDSDDGKFYYEYSKKEYIDSGRYIDVPVNPQVIMQWLIDIAEAIHYLHSLRPPIYFRFLTFSKIYINKIDNRCKLGGFAEAMETKEPNPELVERDCKGFCHVMEAFESDVAIKPYFNIDETGKLSLSPWTVAYRNYRFSVAKDSANHLKALQQIAALPAYLPRATQPQSSEKS